MLGFDLLPRIRNWADLKFYRPGADTCFEHIDTLFGDNVSTGPDRNALDGFERTAISISEGRLSSVTLLRRLGNNSRKNRLYRAFRELGRVIRTITLLRFLADAQLREQITAITNPKPRRSKGSPRGCASAAKRSAATTRTIRRRSTSSMSCWTTARLLQRLRSPPHRTLAADGHPIDTDDLATISPDITHTTRRFGD